jgi:hypothetical protein
MLKNWLIRTKSNHILGPVSKAKVTELYKNGSVKADDEFCSGNGYWFFVKEKALIERYLLGDEVQEFNPISEANDVLVVENSATSVINLKELQAQPKVEDRKVSENKIEEQDEIKLPTSDDLDYPDMGPVLTKSEPISEKLPPPPPEIPAAKVLPIQPKETVLEKKNENVEIAPPKRKEVPLKKTNEQQVPVKGPTEQVSKLRMIIIILIGVAVFAVVYQKFIVKKKLKVSSLIIEEVFSQDSVSSELKKKYLNFKTSKQA